MLSEASPYHDFLVLPEACGRIIRIMRLVGT